MQKRVSVPVTVKCRIGIDEQDSEADLQRFIDTVVGAGCRTFIVHARKAWLNGLSPKQNREIPPLDYDRVYRLKAAHPELTIVLNGGIDDLDAAARHFEHVDGVMLGRAAYQTPYILAEADRRWDSARTGEPDRHGSKCERRPTARCRRRRSPRRSRRAWRASQSRSGGSLVARPS